MKKLIKLFICILLVVPGLSLQAFDFGLILDQDAKIYGTGGDVKFDYSGILIPRFTALLGDSGRIFVSAGINLQSDPLAGVPELLRTDFTWRFTNGQIRAGRMQYSDPLGFVATGLFDGARYSHNTNAGTFSAGAWYTGFQYKKRTEITMTGEELASYSEELNYSDFAKTYFAPKRALLAFDWENPSLKELVRSRVSFIAQFDLTGKDVHTQYVAAKFEVPVKNFIFDFGACLDLEENSGDFGLGLAGELAVSWLLPTAIEDRLMFLGRYSSGNWEDSSLNAFLPVTTYKQGQIFQTKLSGISMLKLDYIARVHKTLSLGISSSYFILTDLGTCTLIGHDGYFAGNEFYGRAVWSPISDVSVNFGAGVFLPAMGNAAPNADPLWKIELNLILSLF